MRFTVTGKHRRAVGQLRGAGPGASRRIGLGVVAGAAEQDLREVEGAPAPVSGVTAAPVEALRHD